uniref:Phosphatidate cytidylyltransferase, mitochondrial n=1 Tax=Fundulus heteroclitus TaxID=8078 RepID=A0A3Q2R3A9_FUNHE
MLKQRVKGLENVENMNAAVRPKLKHFSPFKGLRQIFSSGNLLNVFLFKINISSNRKHYSILKLLGPNKISAIQNDHGASVYYNTLVPVDGRIIKYGVISTDSLIDDLMHWRTLYVAGRLHKPVKMLVQGENAKLRAALVSNLKSAVTASFLMLPESFTEEDLFHQIAGLSYAGDFRMVIGEDKSKVANIVRDNIQHFRILYSNILRDCPQVVYKPPQGKLEVHHAKQTRKKAFFTVFHHVLYWPPGKLLILPDGRSALPHPYDCVAIPSNCCNIILFCRFYVILDFSEKLNYGLLLALCHNDKK